MTIKCFHDTKASFLVCAKCFDEANAQLTQLTALRDLAGKRADEITRLKQWVSDCQSGMYINCVYCGHRYGPEDEIPSSMADVLKEHIEQCPEHPMSKLKAENEKLKMELSQGEEDND